MTNDLDSRASISSTCPGMTSTVPVAAEWPAAMICQDQVPSCRSGTVTSPLELVRKGPNSSRRFGLRKRTLAFGTGSTKRLSTRNLTSPTSELVICGKTLTRNGVCRLEPRISMKSL